MTIKKRPLNLDLNQRLHTHLKVLAATRSKTMSALLEEALQDLLAKYALEPPNG